MKTALAALLLISAPALADTTLTGIVVEFRQGTKLDRVVVKVRDNPNNDPIGTDETDGDGFFSIRLTEEPDQLFITYEPSTNDYGKAGRDRIIRVGPEMGLDTVGLVNRQRRDSSTQSADARNTAGYAASGGDQASVAAEIEQAVEIYGDPYRRLLIEQFRIQDILNRRGIPF
jgi:hypothetical protein